MMAYYVMMGLLLIFALAVLVIVLHQRRIEKKNSSK